MSQDSKKIQKIWTILYYWLLLKCYNIILILIAPIGLEKKFNGS